MTKNTVQRLLVFFLGVPLFILFELYASFGRNILLVLVAFGIQLGSIYETAGIFEKKSIKVNRPYLVVLAVLSSALVYLSPLYAPLLPSNPSPLELLLIVSFLGSLAAITPFAFSTKDQFDTLLPKIAASLFYIFLLWRARRLSGLHRLMLFSAQHSPFHIPPHDLWQRQHGLAGGHQFGAQAWRCGRFTEQEPGGIYRRASRIGPCGVNLLLPLSTGWYKLTG